MNLIIGETSQLSPFFPLDYMIISSRDVDMNYLKDNKWDSVYITFAEQRVHLNDMDFITPNYLYTKDIINSLSDSANRIVIYTTCELWNNKIGCVSIDDKPDYSYSNDYCLSKEMLINYIKNERKNDRLNNVIIIHPFNFNSTYRRADFLFGKIFNCIINKKKIEIGNTYFYRDVVHAKYMVERSINAKKDEMVGSGRLFFINDFIRDLLKHYNMDYNEYIKDDNVTKGRHSDKLYYSHQENVYTYDMLLQDTISDIDSSIEKIINKPMKIEYTWEGFPSIVSGNFKKEDLDYLDEVFEKSMSPIWQELVDDLAQFSFPITDEEIARFEIYLRDSALKGKIYRGMFSSDMDKIYIEPVPRYYGKYIKISK